MDGVHLFSQSDRPDLEKIGEKIGIRGRRVLELSSLDLPVAPGFIFDSDYCRSIAKQDLKAAIKHGIAHIEKGFGRTFGDKSNPLFLKILCSSNMKLAGHYPSIHNVGLNNETFKSFSEHGGVDFAHNERFYLLKTYAGKLCGVDDSPFLEVIKSGETPTAEKISELEGLIPEGKKLPEDPYSQCEMIISKMVEQYADPDDPEDELSVMVQAMVYGNFSPQSFAGVCYTRDYISGEEKIVGEFAHGEFDMGSGKGEALEKLDEQDFNLLKDVSQKLEDNFKELRFFKFTRENGKLWLIEQQAVDKKSTQATIKTLLSLYSREKLTSAEIVEQISPAQLNELLHPVIDAQSAATIEHVSGGLAGSPGAAGGRVFFSTERLMIEHREAILRGEDSDVILCLHASYAEDVKGIEVSQGVITAEGGYSSHAPVVSRSLGKVSLVNQDIQFGKTKDGTPLFKIGDKTVKEGDYITMDVPFYKPPEIYFGKVDLIKPDVEQNGLLEFMKVVDKQINHDEFSVRANADLGRDATLARSFGARGIGLCRTEHMFFAEERINEFRRMILATDEPARREILKNLEVLQTKDFSDLFESMHPYHVTIRLLDAPLHEFLPRTPEMFKAYCDYLDEQGAEYDKEDLDARVERMQEVNPMLGHRGCRVAISYPEIYEMQIRAIFTAAAGLKKDKNIEVEPEIMIPIIMNEAELKFIRNGKKIEGKSIPGIKEIAEEVAKELGSELPKFKVGTMVELPAAALNSGSLAKFADFFSYGTNDLTQTTFGLSRDDANSFFPVYTEYDLLRANPFQVLDTPVKELIGISSGRGRLVRPDLKLGLCGEHGADPANIEFCQQAGLNYVSCSPYSVPLAILATAQINIKKEKAI